MVKLNYSGEPSAAGEFTSPSDVIRVRPALVPSPTNPDRFERDWEHASRDPLPDSWVGVPDSRDVPGETREEILLARSLFCPPGSDVQEHDRVEAEGETWTVKTVPVSAKNPWTGWRPHIECELEAYRG